MKFLFIDTYYPAFLKDHYHLKHAGTIFNALFGTSDFYSQALTRLGHPSITIVLNDRQGQLNWAKRHRRHVGSPIDSVTEWLPYLRGQITPQWVVNTLTEQIKFYKPDILYFLDITYLKPDVLFDLKSKVKLLIGQIASPLPDKSYFTPFDLITSSLPNMVKHIEGTGTQSTYLKLAFEAKILKKLKKIDNSYPVIHIGGYGPIHQQRNKILSTAARHTHIDFFGYQQQFLLKDSPILKNFHGSCWGHQMYQLLHNSKITMTKHITSVASSFANNMTLFEATGCGTLLITDERSNLSEIFVPGKEVVTYTNGTDLAEKINFYLSNETKRAKIAARGQLRTLKEHTYDQRMRELLKILKTKI